VLDADQKMARQVDAKGANAKAGRVFVDQTKRDWQAALGFEHGGKKLFAVL